MRELGRNLVRQVKLLEAESIFRESLAVAQNTQPDSWYTFQNRWLLGGVLVRQAKYAEAEPLLVQGYAGMRAREATAPSGGPASLTETAKQLVGFYEQRSRRQEAAAWRTRLGQPGLDATMPNGLEVFAP